MICDVTICTFVLVVMLTEASCAPIDSENENPIYSNPCVKSCAITYNYQPFCGSDNETYANLSYLQCFKNCGITKIEKAYDGKCKLPSALENPCVKKCTITSGSTPFCGSDNNDYPTKNYLDCFKSCNINIRKILDGECPKEFLIVPPQF